MPLIWSAVMTRLRPVGAAHSGHFWPTAAGRTQSTHTGRPHVEHDSLVGRSECR